MFIILMWNRAPLASRPPQGSVYKNSQQVPAERSWTTCFDHDTQRRSSTRHPAAAMTRVDAQGACAQTCVRQGTAGAPCDNITDPNCICGEGRVIAACVQNNCTSPEQKAFSSIYASVCSLFTTVGGSTSGTGSTTLPPLSIPISIPSHTLPTVSLSFSPPLSSVTIVPTGSTSSGLSQSSSGSSSAVSSFSSALSSVTSGSGSSSATSSTTSGVASQTSNAAGAGKTRVSSGLGGVTGLCLILIGLAIGGGLVM
ncbi:hypothetical protein K466DRAFT_331426 [Polyporus arcularius HHB13444]|uniref:CFEM domain-containing protein n=1 Tax=Polyporus arcularius HHB13444 TaxID=1314778 RepID=A0A5C3NWF4_9APHY|nr:hypothetical protein K466DRAFT_331426 [Polyporus arcularius HHB13444]